MAFENIDTKKFEGLFMSMERQLVMQTSFMESMYNIAIEEREDRKERENFLDTMRREDMQDDSAFNQPGQLPVPKIEEKEVSGIFSSILGMVPGILGAINLSNIAGLLVTGGLIAIVAPAVGGFIEGFAKKALDDLNEMGFELPEGFTSGLSSAIGDAAQWGIIGKLVGGIFGKKIGALVAGTGFVYEQLNKFLDPDQNGEIESGFLEGFDPETVAGIGTALSAALALALPKLISRSLPGIIGGLALPAIMPGDIGPDGKPKTTPGGGPRVTPSTGLGFGGKASLPNIAKGAGALGVVSAAYEFSQTGDLGMATAAGVGSTAGGIIGGAIGSLGGPIGTAIGAAIGATIGDYLGREALEYARTPVSEAGEPIIGSLDGPVAGAPNRMDAFKENFVPYQAPAPMTPEQIAENELAIASAEALSIPMGAYEEPAPKEEATKPAPYFLSDTNAIINKAIQSYVDKIAPAGDISFAIDRERQKRLELINQDATENAKASGAILNAMSAPTVIGGATNNSDNRTTIINQMSNPSSSLDAHYLPQ